MAITYEDIETVILNEAQETAFVNFVTGIWPGTAGNIEGASLRKETNGGTVVTFAVRGKLVATTPAELPTPPFYLDEIDGTDYRYDHIEEVALTGGQISAFASFLAIAWTGAVGDVTNVSFTRVEETSGAPGIDIQAVIRGTKSVATVGDLPPPPLRIVAIT